MIGAVKVDPATFKQSVVLSVQERTDFESKKQKATKDGVPLWRVQCAVTTWEDRTDTIMVTVASPESPADLTPPLTPVRFDGLQLGMMERDGKTTIWFSAEAVVPVGGPTK
jgi:hypothetical protein